MAKVKTFTTATDAGEHVISEANGRASRDEITLAAQIVGFVIQPGTVMGKVTATGHYVPHAPAAADGSQNADGISFSRVEFEKNATRRGVNHSRDSEVNGKKLVWAAGITGPQKTAAITALAAKGVLVR